MSQLSLLAGAREFDLPPKWDGHVVDWEPWQSTWTTAEFHAKRECCPACGSLRRSVMAAGVLKPLAGETFASARAKRARRSGRTYAVEMIAVPAWPVLGLMAFRCPDCRHDTVYEIRTKQWWDLDFTDYGPHGSTNPEGPRP